MNNTSFRTIHPLIDSEGGVHFTAYIVNHAGDPAIKEQLVEALKVASEDTRLVLSREERKKFLKPIQALLTDETISTIKGNIGIFRSRNLFRVMNIPVSVDEYCTVASSFHIKPLLRWAQEDRSFRLITIGESMACFYLGTQHSLRHIDTFVYQKNKLKSLATFSIFGNNKKTNEKQAQMRKLTVWLEERLDKTTHSYSSPLFVVAAKDIQDFVLQNISYSNIRIIENLRHRDLAQSLAQIRSLLREETENAIRAKLYDFKLAQALDLTESNVHKIAKAANQGLVKKLLVAADRKLFGKLAAHTGKLTLHLADVDHEDEDILDDIAQAVVRGGGDVMVAPTKNIPGGHPLLAITETQDPVHQKKFMIKSHHKPYLMCQAIAGT